MCPLWWQKDVSLTSAVTVQIAGLISVFKSAAAKVGCQKVSLSFGSGSILPLSGIRDGGSIIHGTYLGSVKADIHQCDVHCVVEGQSDALNWRGNGPSSEQNVL